MNTGTQRILLLVIDFYCAALRGDTREQFVRILRRNYTIVLRLNV
tara:strand:+ start:2234 stop:2368 length:135 start_codon:yes stop_codon:yes gene_type:complete